MSFEEDKGQYPYSAVKLRAGLEGPGRSVEIREGLISIVPDAEPEHDRYAIRAVVLGGSAEEVVFHLPAEGVDRCTLDEFVYEDGVISAGPGFVHPDEESSSQRRELVEKRGQGEGRREESEEKDAERARKDAEDKKRLKAEEDKRRKDEEDKRHKEEEKRREEEKNVRKRKRRNGRKRRGRRARTSELRPGPCRRGYPPGSRRGRERVAVV